MRTQIYVDTKLVRSGGPRAPTIGPLVVRTDGETHNAYEIVVNGPSRFVTDFAKPLIAEHDRAVHVWVETDAEVEIVR